MSNCCQFITGGCISCDVPASIKREGVWLCAEHYDFCEENAVNYVAQDPNWVPCQIPEDAWED